VDYAVLWGLLAFLLNFVPTVGSFIAAVPAVLLAVVQLGPLHAGLTLAGFVVVNLVMGNMIEPRWMGRGLNLSPLVVFVSLVLWGWVLGPVGMLLSIPLTIMIRLLLRVRMRLAGSVLCWAQLTAPPRINTDPSPAVTYFLRLHSRPAPFRL